MTRHALLVALAVAAPLAAGCPIPQTVPEYPKGSSITPPRIVAEKVTPGSTVVRVPASCPTPPSFPLHAGLVDEDTTEVVRARFFVDYDPTLQAGYQPWQDFAVGPDSSGSQNTARDVDPPEPFLPYGWPISPAQLAAGLTDPAGPGVVRVVELVVSNGFPPGEPASPLPYRTPLPSFETQVYRWVFLQVAPTAEVPCPP